MNVYDYKNHWIVTYIVVSCFLATGKLLFEAKCINLPKAGLDDV
jgi:hypothetical protein